MTIEQNQPQPQPNQAPSAGGSTQGQGQHRRRRRRRKGFPNGSNKGQVNGPANEAGQATSSKQTAKSKQNQNRFAKASNSRNGGGSNGNGGAQGGGRRKSKPRRQQVFVGPMDHSYRAANGNVADVSPSTIEFRGNSQNGFYNEPPASEPAIAPVREDAPVRIFCFIEDLFVLAKIQETARKLGVKVGFVKADKDIVSRLANVPEGERPSLIVFDLNNVNAKPLTLIPRIKSKLKRGTSIIGFLSHLQGDLKAKAVEAGCDMVMPRSAFSQNLPNLLRRHGLEEELEAVEA
ncbi:MAG TPA: response regulator [Acidobacteriaceae bacterium]|nr:response regulator [Acidobacteriaceae bacterium]